VGELKTRRCDRADAKVRLGHAYGFLEAATLFHGEQDQHAANVAASNAVHAAIAAADAACCAALGCHAQGQDHHQAGDLLATVNPGGPTAAKALVRALAVKNNAAYGLTALSTKDRDSAIRQAEKLIAFAQEIVDRG